METASSDWQAALLWQGDFLLAAHRRFRYSICRATPTNS
jgi:hypothetical protein